MKVLKMLGYLNLFSRCLRHKYLCNAEQNLFVKRITQQRQKNIDIQQQFETFFRKPHSSMEAYPQWGYEKAPEHDSYDVISRRYNKTFNFVFTVYQHKLTKMQVMSIGSNDPLDIERSFAFYVKTLPETDEGIPHILEHTVLAGSHKYKDPFTTLMKGSLYTLLNAYTYSDRTVYLARSMNARDFYNIIDVYIDCVFRPTVMEKKSFFQREGWSYLLEQLTEEEKKNDKIPKIGDYKVSYNGIVFSEMKGVFSNPIRVLGYESEKLLFPDTVYSKVSGGDPEAITNLTYERFRNFYFDKYNPQKIKLFVSSNESCKELLDFVDRYLQHIDLGQYKGNGKIDQIELQKYREGPFYKIKKYATNTEQKEHLVLISWVLNPAQRNEEDINLSLNLPLDSFVLSIINYLLIQTPTSVLYKALIESGLGTGVLTDVIDSDLVQQVFSVGLKGIYEKNSGTKEGENDVDNVHYAVEKVILDALKKEVEKGFNKEAVEAAINSIEFRLKEANLESSKSTNFILEMIAKLNYNRDPLEGFDYDIYLTKIKENVKTIPNYLENFVKKHLINNKHRVVVLLKGDENIGSEMAEKEQASLKKRIDSLSESEKEDIVKTFEELKMERMQNITSEDIDKVPLLKISDLNEKTLEVPLTLYFTNGTKEDDFEQYVMTKSTEQAKKNMEYFKNKYVLGEGSEGITTPEGVNSTDIPILVHEVETDGIVYIQFGFSLNDFTLNELFYINLFRSVILENRTSKKTEEEFILAKEKNIGRLSASVHTYSKLNHLKALNKYNAGALFNYEIQVLNHKCSEALNIAMEALKESDLSNSKKVIEILKRFIDNYRTAFNDDANYILSNHIRSRFNANSYIKNIMSGFKNYKRTLQILETAEKDYSAVEKVLNGIREKLLTNKKLIVNVTADKASLNKLFTDSKEAFKSFLSPFKNNPDANKIITWNDEIQKLGLIAVAQQKDLLVTPTLVNYVGMAGTLFNENEIINPAFMVVVAALQNAYLWEVIREVNGAYGVAASLNYDGVVLMTSYRDPNLEKTLDTYRKSIEGLRQMADKMTERDLLRYIIFIIRKIDKPKRGVDLGNLSFWRILMNETEQDREDYRRYVLGTTKKDFYDFANLLEKKVEELEKNIVAVTNSNNAERFTKENEGFRIIPLE